MPPAERDRDRQTMRVELDGLQAELARLSKTLDSYNSLSSRLASRMAHALPCEETTGTGRCTEATPLNIEQQLDSLLRALTDRTASLAHLTSSLTELGFPGSNAAEIVASLSSGLRAARLELEYLTPGEIALPLTSHGAESLDLLLSRLRELGRRAKEDEAALDEYRTLEASLRQQLSARADAMEAIGAELSQAQALIDEKSFRIQELESGVKWLKDAVNGYVSNIRRLEGVIRRIEEAAREAQESFRLQLDEKEVKLRVLEGQLAMAQKSASSLQGDDQNKRHEEDAELDDRRSLIELPSELEQAARARFSATTAGESSASTQNDRCAV